VPCRQNDDPLLVDLEQEWRGGKPIFLLLKGLYERGHAAELLTARDLRWDIALRRRNLRALHVERQIAAAGGCADAKAHERRPIRLGPRERIARADGGLAFQGASTSSVAGFAAGRICAWTKLFFTSAIWRGCGNHRQFALGSGASDRFGSAVEN